MLLVSKAGGAVGVCGAARALAVRSGGGVYTFSGSESGALLVATARGERGGEPEPSRPALERAEAGSRGLLSVEASIA